MGGYGSGRPEIWPSLWSLYSARYDRLIRKAKGLRWKLHDYTQMAPIDHVDMAGYPPKKPPRMHWNTYSRLACELKDVETEAGQLFIDHSTRMLERISSVLTKSACRDSTSP